MEEEMKRNFRNFEDARKFAQSLNLTSYVEWLEFRKSGKRPDDIPSNPERVYKNKFLGFIDWLGTGNLRHNPNLFRNFEDARKFAQSLNLKGEKEWKEFCKSDKKPLDVPSSPWVKYKSNGWKGMGDFLGTGNIATRNRIFLSFEDARKFAQSLNLTGINSWRKYSKLGKLPINIPSNPQICYKTEFTNWGDFLGTGNIANFNKKFRSFNDSREFVRKLKLKNWDEWKEYCKSGNKPDNIPALPHLFYKKDKKEK